MIQLVIIISINRRDCRLDYKYLLIVLYTYKGYLCKDNLLLLFVITAFITNRRLD